MDFKALARIGLGAAVLVLAFAIWFALQAFPFGGEGKLVTITVTKGETYSQLAGELHALGVVASPFALRLDLSLLGEPTLVPGVYKFAQKSSFSTVKAVLSGGPNLFTVYPGMTIHEIAGYLASDRGTTFANQFLTATAALAAASPYQPDLNPPSLAGSADNVNAFEGLVGVGHYVLEPGETGAQLATAMASGFSKEAAAVGLTTSTRVAGLNAYQLITAASIVEREGYYPSNMPKVARVVFNRLAHHGPLQMDSTVKYPLGMDAGVVTPALLQTVTPYNTYRVTGLTPTPICAVSTAALTATLHAPPGPWYYFVVINKQGVERFSVTYAEQQAAEKVAQRNGVG